MITSSRELFLACVIIGLIIVTTAEITDMIGEAICAAECLANFTSSLDESERTFLSQRPDLTEPHCLSKRSNCSLCLEVCQWPRQSISSCKSSCDNLEETVFQMFYNTPAEVHRRTCLDACIFSFTNWREREMVVGGLRPASCPLPSSWPDASTCLPHQRCTTDADCGQNSIAKCCRFDACIEDLTSTPPSSYLLSRLHRLTRQPTGFCMRISNDTAFAFRDVPPIPDPPSVKQTAITRDEPEVYKLELDWPDYYNVGRFHDILKWSSPAVFLVQVRLLRDLSGSLLGDESEFGDEILQEELFSEWRSLVWTTKIGAVLSDLSPGTWYQFRLKASSRVGFGGNGRPSRPVKIMTLPEAPRNLTESSSRIYANKVEIKLQWEPPSYGSVPIKYYRVSWSKNRSAHVDDNSQDEYEAKLPRTAIAYTLQNLEPGNVYKVEVTSVAIVDGKEWFSPPVSRFIKTMPKPSKEYLQSENFYYNTNGRSCRCGDSFENRNFFHQHAFFEDGDLKMKISIPFFFLSQFFGSIIKDSWIFQLIWYPKVCIEARDSKIGLSSAPSVKNVYADALAELNLDNLRFQCHYKLQIRLTRDLLLVTTNKTLELCFCTPSCTEVTVKSGPGPTNCSFADIFIPHRPVDIGYRLFPTKTMQRHSTDSGITTIYSQTEPETIFPARNILRKDSNPVPGFVAVIFWKPHSGMIMATGGYTKHADSALNTYSDSRQQTRGYRIIWGPRLVEPIEPDMYVNGIAPQLDPERTESKVVESNVHNVILRNLEPDTLYIVQVQTIGANGDSPINAVFFTTPSLRKYDGTDSSGGPRSITKLFVSLTPLHLFIYCVMLQ